MWSPGKGQGQREGVFHQLSGPGTGRRDGRDVLEQVGSLKPVTPRLTVQGQRSMESGCGLNPGERAVPLHQEAGSSEAGGPAPWPYTGPNCRAPGLSPCPRKLFAGRGDEARMP